MIVQDSEEAVIDEVRKFYEAELSDYDATFGIDTHKDRTYVAYVEGFDGNIDLLKNINARLGDIVQHVTSTEYYSDGMEAFFIAQ